MRHRPHARVLTCGLILALLAFIAAPTPSPADAPSQEGCMNQWLFNGVWRVQVTKVEPLMDGSQQVGWQVTEVWRNGTNQVLAPADSQLLDQQLIVGSATILASASTTGTLSMQQVSAHDFPASGELTYVQVFREANVDPATKPSALNVIFNGSKLVTFKSKPQFSTPKYNYHFKLDCQATGAAAQAQGGSSQIAAKEGCLNQWMSNGIWRVRATAVGPDMGNDNAAQIGWMISEEWTNLVGKPLAPGDTFITDQQLVLASGSSVSSTNSAGTSMNQQQLVYHTFPAGGSFSYQQRFRSSAFDVSDKPAKLLVTFDSTSQNKRANAPHYSLPPNFRISLTCSK